MQKMTIGHIKQALILLKSAYPYYQPEEATAASWMQFFNSVNPEDFLSAIKSHIAINKHIPAIAEINDRLNKPKSGLGSEKIIQAISKYGSYDESGAKAYLGDLWPAVQRYGWKNLCAMEISQLPTISAQLERAITTAEKNNNESQSIARIDNKQFLGIVDNLTKALTYGAK